MKKTYYPKIIKRKKKDEKKDDFDLNVDYSGIRFDVRELKAELSEEPKFEAPLVEHLSLFKDAFHPKSDVIYYPCSNLDLSVQEVFPDSKVMYVDINYEVFESLKDKGLEAYHASALEFDPGDVDILFLSNPQIDPDMPVSHVVKGGYVVCGNYQGTLSLKLARDENFQLVGVIEKDEMGKCSVTTEDLQDYITLVEKVDLEDALKVMQTKRRKGNHGNIFIFRKIK